MCKDRTRSRACPLGGCPAALHLGLFASAASVLRAGASPSRFPVTVRARGRLRGECLHRQSRSFSYCHTEPPAAPFKGQKSAVVLHPPPIAKAQGLRGNRVAAPSPPWPLSARSWHRRSRVPVGSGSPKAGGEAELGPRGRERSPARALRRGQRRLHLAGTGAGSRPFPARDPRPGWRLGVPGGLRAAARPHRGAEPPGTPPPPRAPCGVGSGRRA